jgi:hypothetical protein
LRAHRKAARNGGEAASRGGPSPAVPIMRGQNLLPPDSSQVAEPVASAGWPHGTAGCRSRAGGMYRSILSNAATSCRAGGVVSISRRRFDRARPRFYHALQLQPPSGKTP